MLIAGTINYNGDPDHVAGLTHVLTDAGRTDARLGKAAA